jgi:hypothetical protein
LSSRKLSGQYFAQNQCHPDQWISSSRLYQEPNQQIINYAVLKRKKTLHIISGKTTNFKHNFSKSSEQYPKFKQLTFINMYKETCCDYEVA